MKGAAPRLDPGRNERLPKLARAWWPALVVALIGASVRWHDLSTQILLDDEWHSLFRAATEDLVTVATEYARIATSIPMNVFNKVLLESGAFPRSRCASSRCSRPSSRSPSFRGASFGFCSKTMALAATTLFA